MLLHLQPWYINSIPINFNPGPDTGGVLEVALQLNALNTSWQHNQNDKEALKPLSRQVILHGCFAQHVTNTPIGLTNPRYCPLWLRLATNHGQAVSVAHAAHAAITEALTSSQPPSRSERLPQFDTSFLEKLDRSFFHLPYPSAGRWYLNLYAECYTTTDVFCGLNEATSIDVSLVLSSTPCVNFRCRNTGEGSTLTPSRLLHSDKDLSSAQTRFNTLRWHPPWWKDLKQRNGSRIRYKSPLKTSSTDFNWSDDRYVLGEGVCVITTYSTVSDISTCACPVGFGGIGCAPLPKSYFISRGFDPYRGTPSRDALILALSNFALLPAVLLALIRRLWVPTLVYLYTMIFSLLYHLCDTDENYFPTGGEPIHTLALKSKLWIDRYKAKPISSTICVLPMDVLSFCDFFGGIFSVWVTMITAAALPVRYAECAYIFGVLSLTVAVQVIRYSAGLFVSPLILGGIILFYSWIRNSLKLHRLFPPVQWWLSAFIPGAIFSIIGVIIFVGINNSPQHYTVLHSLWHIFMGLSLIGFLPWPHRWRIALSPITPVNLPLSCGSISHKIKTISNNTNSEIHTNVIGQSVRENGLDPNQTNIGINSKPIAVKFKLYENYIGIYNSWMDKLDQLLEMNYLLDSICTKWPKLKWILPYGYKQQYSTAQNMPQIDQMTECN